MKALAAIFIISLSLLTFCGSSIAAPTALVLHDGLTETFAVSLVNLLGHFREYEARTSLLDSTEPGEIVSAEAVFVLMAYDSPPPGPRVREALEKRTGLTVFAGEHRWMGSLPSVLICDRVSYRGSSFWIEGYGVRKKEKPFGETVVSMSQSGQDVPFIEKNGNRWMIHGIPMFEVPAWITADALHDILGISHAPKRTAMLRLEDINPSYSGERLKKLQDCIEYLYSEGVPFSMAVFPVFINARGEPRALLITDNEPLMKLLRRAEKMGGTVIMHGTSHQYHQVSGEGSEFWDVETDGPIPDEKAYFHERMRYGLWLFKEAGLHPKLFEAPHYNMPLSLQKELTGYFGTIAGSLMITDESYTISQDFPYIIYRSWAGLTVLPEQLGYIATDAESMSIVTILERLDILTAIMRDPFACFFYHPYVAGDLYLRELIPQIRDRGYVFADVSQFGGDPLVVVTSADHIWPLAYSKVPLSRYLPLIIGLIGAAILVIIYFRQTKKKKREMFRG